VRDVEAGLVHRALDAVGERVDADLPLDRGPARVARERDGQDVVAALQGGQHELTGAPGVDEAVQAHQRRPGAAAVLRDERQGQLSLGASLGMSTHSGR
jgi:hypothetical protein